MHLIDSREKFALCAIKEDLIQERGSPMLIFKQPPTLELSLTMDFCFSGMSWQRPEHPNGRRELNEFYEAAYPAGASSVYFDSFWWDKFPVCSLAWLVAPPAPLHRKLYYLQHLLAECGDKISSATVSGQKSFPAAVCICACRRLHVTHQIIFRR